MAYHATERMSAVTFFGLMRLPMPEQCDAGAGRRLWLGANIGWAETVVDLGGVGTMFEPWHPASLVTAYDDLSGFGPGHHYYGTLQRGDVQELPFTDRQFDVAVLAEVLEHVPRPVQTIREAMRVAGRVLLTTPFEHRWTNGSRFRVPGHVRLYTPDTFAADLRAAEARGTFGMLEFGSWCFFIAVLAREGMPVDRLAEQMAGETAVQPLPVEETER